MKCPKCNNEINNEAIKFCPFCGTNLSGISKNAAPLNSGAPRNNSTPQNRVPQNNGAPRNRAPQNNGAPRNGAPQNYGAPRNNAPQNMGPRNNPPSPNPPIRTESNGAGKSPVKKIVFGVLIALLLIALGVGGYFAASKFISDGSAKTSDKKSSEKDEDEEDDKKKTDKEKEHDVDEEDKKEDDKDDDAVSFSASSDTEEKTKKADDKEDNAVTFVPEDSENEEDVAQDTNQAAGFVPDVTEDSEYLCYYASDRLLNDSDYQSVLSQHPETFPGNRTLAQMIENELFARHGYIFKAQELNNYFLQYSWYQNIRNTDSCSNNQDVILKRMSSTEKSNIKFLDRYIPD